MYRFSYVENVAAQPQVADRQQFLQLLRSEKVKQICEQILQAPDADAKSKLKRSLPAICWHACFPNGKRKNYSAQPSGLIMMDVDHVINPRPLFESISGKALQLGLLAAHITPSSHGLRLVFPIPQGKSLEQAQAYYAHALNLQVDACTKDLARLSFCVPEAYFLYLNEEALFEGEGDTGTGACPVSKGPGQDPVPASSNTAQPEPPAQPEPLTQPEPPAQPYPQDYEGIPYPLIVGTLCELLGGTPAHGSRNNFIFTMAAYLRYICNDDPDWIAQILPTYGEVKEKWRRTIDSACQRAQYKVMPLIVKRAIGRARSRIGLLEGREDKQEPPTLPARLPRLIRHLIKNVPEVCRPAVANAVFPALAAHLKDVRFTLIDGTEKEATFMCVTMARQSSGKSAVNKPIEYIIADIVERDEMSRKREQDWKDAMQQKGANKEKPKRPDDLCVQVLVSDMTNAAFVQRMKDAGGRYLYTNLEELALLKQLQTNGTKDIGKIICLCFDNGKYGQERVGTQSVTARVDLRWNWNASSTIQKGQEFFKGRLVDGTLSRVNFCTIIPDKSKPFHYGQYDEQYAEELKPFINNLNLAQGNITCRPAQELARKLLEKCQEVGALTDDDVYQDLAFRAVTIAYLKAMVLYIAHDMTWSREIAQFTEWSLDYDLWCKSYFFGEKVREEKAGEQITKVRGRQNLLELLPQNFSRQDAIEVRRLQGLTENPTSMLSTWVSRGYISLDPQLGMYEKTDKYNQSAKSA